MGLFASPLIKIQLPDHYQLKRFFHGVIAEPSLSDAKLKHYHSGENVFELYSELHLVREQIEQAGKFAYQELLNHSREGVMLITSAWFNLSQVGATQLSHSHANALLSGTLYLHADEQTQIEFYHPLSVHSQHAELFDAPDNRENEYGLSYHKNNTSITVTEGDCLFWPSQLRHGYQNNQTPNRLSLSFNMLPSSLNATYQLPLP